MKQSVHRTLLFNFLQSKYTNVEKKEFTIRSVTRFYFSPRLVIGNLDRLFVISKHMCIHMHV